MSTRLLAILVALSLFLAGCGRRSPAPDLDLIDIQAPRAVIFDTDMAHEDMVAALFLLSHPNVDVEAITVTGTGEAHCEPGVQHALGLLALSGHDPIPVACGRQMPLAGSHFFPAEWRQGADEAYGVPIPVGGTKSELSAPDLIIDLVQNSEQPITIVAVGPLTNLAEAFQKAPGISEKIEGIYVMGGAVMGEGNVGNSGVGIENGLAEWNIYIDPVAANIVFNSGTPITLIPLDATKDVPITRLFYQALKENRNTPESNLAFDILTANLGFVDSGGFQFWDSLTSAIFTDEGLATFEELQLSVVEEEGPETGSTRPDPKGAKVRVAMSADRGIFETLLLTILDWDE